MDGVFRRFFRNIGTLLLALLLGIVVWVTATLATNPISQQAVSGVPITTINQPEDTILFEPIVDEVVVQARASDKVLADLQPSDFEAVMDLSIVEPGVPVPVPVGVDSSNELVRIEGWSPEQQTVHLEAVRTITLPVAIQVEGEAATGYQSTGPVVNPVLATVRGPEPFLAEVTTVAGLLDVEGAREDVVRQAVAELIEPPERVD